jgi:hypothetical protein
MFGLKAKKSGILNNAPKVFKTTKTNIQKSLSTITKKAKPVVTKAIGRVKRGYRQVTQRGLKGI